MRVFAVPVILAALCVCLSAVPAPAKKKPPKTFFFVHDGGDHGSPNQVFVYEVAKKGKLRVVPGSPFVSANTEDATSGDCNTVAYAAGRKMLFAGGGNGISAWNVGRGGALSELSGSPFGGFEATGIAVVERDGATFVYASETNEGRLRGYQVGVDGTLTPLATPTFAAPNEPYGMAVVGARLFVTNASVLGGGPLVFDVLADGALQAIPGSPVGTARSLVIYAARGRPAVYLPDCPVGNVVGFSAAGAAVSPTPGSPYASGVYACNTLAIGGARAVALPYGSTAQVFRINTDLSLTPLLGAQPTGLANPAACAIAPNDACLIVADYGATTVRSFRFLKDGGLKKVGDLALPAADVTGSVIGQQ